MKKVTRTLDMLVLEGLLIADHTGSTLMNRRGEWGQNLPPQFTVEGEEKAPKQKKRKKVMLEDPGSNCSSPSKKTKVEVSSERDRPDPRAPSGGDSGVEKEAKTTGTQIREGPLDKFISRAGITGLSGESNYGQLKGCNEDNRELNHGNRVRRGEQREESASHQSRDREENPVEPTDPDCC